MKESDYNEFIVLVIVWLTLAKESQEKERMERVNESVMNMYEQEVVRVCSECFRKGKGSHSLLDNCDLAFFKKENTQKWTCQWPLPNSWKMKQMGIC